MLSRRTFERAEAKHSGVCADEEAILVRTSPIMVFKVSVAEVGRAD